MLLGGLAAENRALAAALAVLVAILLMAKAPLQNSAANSSASENCKTRPDAAAAALVVLPLLPAHAIDPWGAVSPS
nr:hypothetical protein [Staphylococcus epidermidis]